MSNTLTVRLNTRTESRLGQLVSEEGASLESVVERLLDDISGELDGANNQLSEEQLADLRERIRNPGPIASPERVAAVLAKFRV